MTSDTAASMAQLCSSLRVSMNAYNRPKDCFSLNDIFAQAEKDIKASIAVNQDLRDEIDDLRDVIQTMTDSTKALEKELSQEQPPKPAKRTKPAVLITMRVDPNVKLARGNTLGKAVMWEKDPQN
ncbi:unnamed protein product [Meganyctiphanes norvegica]|uniref:Uncharacterized protein n=1 Tax=Meganyctiphanes norvegica TaxID=48144 RepID=A0AAV2QUQ1_MEGNR